MTGALTIRVEGVMATSQTGSGRAARLPGQTPAMGLADGILAEAAVWQVMSA